MYSPQTGALIDADAALLEAWRESHPDAVACNIIDVADDEGRPFGVYADLDDGPRVELKETRRETAMNPEPSMWRIGAGI